MVRKRKSGGGGIGCMGIFVVVALVSCLSHGGGSSSSSSTSSSSIDSNASSVTNSSTSTPSTTTKSSDTTTSSQPTTPAPQPVPAQQPAPAQAAPPPSPAPQQPQAEVKIVSIESPVPRNGTETVVAQVPPGTTASIEVDYASGPSHAAGLEDKTADSSGRVSWSWHVGGRTTLGSWPVTVSDGGASDQASFEVVH